MKLFGVELTAATPPPDTKKKIRRGCKKKPTKEGDEDEDHDYQVDHPYPVFIREEEATPR